MSRLRAAVSWVTEAGISADTSTADARYIRFLNATLLLFVFGQIPILPMMVTLGRGPQILVNLGALSLCGLGFVLNRGGHHLSAKILVIAAVTANTIFFAAFIGSSAPTHLWLVPGAVLGVLVFKPSEWPWAALLVGLSMVGFSLFEVAHPNLEPLARALADPAGELRAAQGSTMGAMALTLTLVWMMHRRFAQSEAALSRAKSQSDRLLRAILPESIAHELSQSGTTQATRHEDVSLLFADIVGFTPLAASMPAEETVDLLSEIFMRFDRLITRCGVEKIKTIGDAYMVAGGVPEPTPGHADQLARCAVGMLELMEQFSEEWGLDLQLRIGLHRGPAVAGVIGTTKFAYDLWGESVNLASRLESSGMPGRIHVSDAFRSGADEALAFEERGEVVLKGLGPVRTHWLIPRPEDGS